MRRSNHARGFTLVEAIFTIALVVLVFGGIFGMSQLILQLSGKSKATAGALALANERMEFIRSLPYNQVGTIGSPPFGSITQNSTTTLNGIEYQERVLITYIDDDADGLGTSDGNLILEDYKLVKVEYSWNDRGTIRSVNVISNVIPVGIESNVGGGTIRVNVFDEATNPVQGAEVLFVNDSLATTTYTTRLTNNAGIALLSGAPEGAGYEITVTKPGFSTDGTYTASSTLPNPLTAPVAVVESAVSTMNFQIATSSELEILTVSPAATSDTTDDFDSLVLLATTSSTTVSGGALVLSEVVPGTYHASGTAISSLITPVTLQSWQEIIFTGTTTASTSYDVFVYYDTGSTFELVPDFSLPGNSTGFSSSPIDISFLSTSTYPDLALGARLNTTDASVTPEIYDWTLRHVTSQAPIGSIDFRLFGQKSIGTDALLQSVLKYDEVLATNGAGRLQLTDMEWDFYDINLLTGGYTVTESCEPLPHSLDPDVSDIIKLTMIPGSANALRVSVTETDGTPVHGADVRLVRGSTDLSDVTSTCGQAFFTGGLATANDYTLMVSKSGYIDYSDPGQAIDGSTSSASVILN